jgi:hypothetical protein
MSDWPPQRVLPAQEAERFHRDRLEEVSRFVQDFLSLIFCITTPAPRGRISVVDCFVH